MHRTGICVSVAIAALLAASAAEAQSEGGVDAREEARTGFYAGVAGSVGLDDFSTFVLRGVEGYPGGVALGSFDPSLGLHGRGGYRLSEWVAAEFHVEWLSGFDGSARAGGSAPGKFEIEMLALTTDAKFYPLTGRFQPFATLGFGALSALYPTAFSGDKSEWDFAGRLGGGIDIYVTEHIVLNFDATYVLPSDVLAGLEYASFGWGFLYRF